MLQLCSYETVALGYSAFCGLFSQKDYLNYEYYFDLVNISLPPSSLPPPFMPSFARHIPLRRYLLPKVYIH